MSTYYKQTQASISLAKQARQQREAAARSDAWNRYLKPQPRKRNMADLALNLALLAIAAYGLFGGGASWSL